ncbi:MULTISPECIES: protein YrbN [Tatumella]
MKLTASFHDELCRLAAVI